MANTTPHPTVIFGLGREGLSTYTHLTQTQPELPLLLLDEKPLQQLGPEWQAIEATHPGRIVTQLPADLQNPLVYCSPGIPPHNKLYKELAAKNATFSSNLELFFAALPSISEKIVTIGVTGTKGKSTTSALLYHLLKTAKLPAVYAGNVGIPALDVLPELAILAAQNESIYIVLELSSHQLSRLEVSPQIAVLQNILPEHLDYYDSFEAYSGAKATITKYQTSSDKLIYSSDFATVAAIAQQSAAKKYAFSIENPTANELSARIHAVLATSAPKLLGKHNWYNMAPSIILAETIGIEPTTVTTALETFEPLSHRLEVVETTHDDGVLYINDSLATTPEATMAALDAFSDKTVILIAGGYDRSLDFFDLAKKITTTRAIKALILFPPTGEKIVAFMYKIDPSSPLLATSYYKVESMAEAVRIARGMAKKGDVVLLSPGAASFGRFRDYADRGEQFMREVRGERN